MSPRVVLVGLPGSGKTTTGRRLAKILAVDFADSDELVETQTGRSVRELFADGEPVFRAAEASAIATALRGFDGVLALGGGALGAEATRAALAASGAPVVLLRAGIATLAERVGDAQSRPLLVEDPSARLRQLADERASVYASAATFTVDSDARTPGQVASQIAAELHRRQVRGV